MTFNRRALLRNGAGISRARLSVFCLCFLLLTGSAGCADAGNKPQKLAALEFTIKRADGETAGIRAEVARTGAERETGLMFRRSLADGEGMLFVFERDQMLSFWMKNTLIPLSIAYIAYNGRILEIHDMKPQDLTPIRSGRSARYALEVPQGWFEKAGIRPGDTLVLSPLEEN
ncbi:MAG: DUF192 domain-containing protein [Treponema sp.]|jgi:uncharacterized membrane protein (UPF0127 family)|nr:DUF192 domain-containing protein [Treponema sp.]